MSVASPREILRGSPGTRAGLLGNLAIVRGAALKAGVQFFSCYPGTPSSEIGDTFSAIADEADVVFEYSVNEKIAIEEAFAARLTGARAMSSMKRSGLSDAGDPISTLPYVGVELTERFRQAEALLAASDFFPRSGSSRRRGIASGTAYADVRPVIADFGLRDELTLQQVGACPIPQQVLVEFLAGVNSVLGVEEATPFVEDAIREYLGMPGRKHTAVAVPDLPSRPATPGRSIGSCRAA